MEHCFNLPWGYIALHDNHKKLKQLCTTLLFQIMRNLVWDGNILQVQYMFANRGGQKTEYVAKVVMIWADL